MRCQVICHAAFNFSIGKILAIGFCRQKRFFSRVVKMLSSTWWLQMIGFTINASSTELCLAWAYILASGVRCFGTGIDWIFYSYQVQKLEVDRRCCWSCFRSDGIGRSVVAFYSRSINIESTGNLVSGTEALLCQPIGSWIRQFWAVGIDFFA